MFLVPIYKRVSEQWINNLIEFERKVLKCVDNLIYTMI